MTRERLAIAQSRVPQRRRLIDPTQPAVVGSDGLEPLCPHQPVEAPERRVSEAARAEVDRVGRQLTRGLRQSSEKVPSRFRAGSEKIQLTRGLILLLRPPRLYLGDRAAQQAAVRLELDRLQERLDRRVARLAAQRAEGLGQPEPVPRLLRSAADPEDVV